MYFSGYGMYGWGAFLIVFLLVFISLSKVAVFRVFRQGVKQKAIFQDPLKILETRYAKDELIRDRTIK